VCGLGEPCSRVAGFLTSGGNCNSLVVLHNMGVLVDGIVWRKVADILRTQVSIEPHIPAIIQQPQNQTRSAGF